MTRKWLTSFASSWLLAAAAVSAFAPAALAQQDRADAPRSTDLVRDARQLYQAAAWPKTAVRVGFALGGFAVEGLTGGETECLPPAPVSRLYRDAAGTPRVLVELQVADSAAAAQERLLACLAQRTSPEPAPTAASLGITVGDAGFVGVSGAGPDRLEWVAFLRGNLMARVKCLDPRVTPHPDLGRIARSLDLAFQETRLAGGSKRPPSPVIRKLAAERDHCRAGDVLALDVQCTDPAGGAPIFNWIVGGPDQGQGYVERDKLGNWRLHTTGPGPLALTLVLVASTGTTATSSLQITVGE